MCWLGRLSTVLYTLVDPRMELHDVCLLIDEELGCILAWLVMKLISDTTCIKSSQDNIKYKYVFANK